MSNDERGAENGGQAPSPVRWRELPSAYKRNLPHIQRRDETLFVTFSTHRRWELPAAARALVLQHCLHDHGTKLLMHAAVVMPDHVHLVFTPLRDEIGDPYRFAEIMQTVKGASAHSINRLLRRSGRVWDEESFDRSLRSDESRREKAEYICANPVRAGIASSEDEYPYLWREWVEGAPYDRT